MRSNGEEDLVFYCTRCLAIDVRTEDGITYCPHCFKRKNPSTIDITTFDRWEELYMEKYGHPLVERKSIYDDITEAFNEDAEEVMTNFDAIDNGLVVREKINLNLERLKG